MLSNFSNNNPIENDKWEKIELITENSEFNTLKFDLWLRAAVIELREILNLWGKDDEVLWNKVITLTRLFHILSTTLLDSKFSDSQKEIIRNFLWENFSTWKRREIVERTKICKLLDWELSFDEQLEMYTNLVKSEKKYGINMKF